MKYQPKFDALVDEYMKLDEFIAPAIAAGKKALPVIKKGIQKHGPEIAQGLQQILQTLGGDKEEQSPEEEEPVPGNTELGTEDQAEEENTFKGIFNKNKNKPIDQKQANTDIAINAKPGSIQQVATVPTKAKKIPTNVQRQMIDGAINGILNGGVDPSILKKQVKQAIGQIK
jgi:hypothetical protein